MESPSGEDTVKHVEVSEFLGHVAKYLYGRESVSIEQDGRPLGFYWPMRSRKGSKEAREARERLERTIQKILDETGYTEEELARFFDLTVPLESE